MFNPSFSCNQVVEYLDAYLDNELNDKEQALIQQHLNNCAGCSKQLADLTRLVQDLKSLPRVSLPYDLTSVALETKTFQLPNQIWLGLSAAAALALIFVLVLLPGHLATTFYTKQPAPKTDFIATHNLNAGIKDKKSLSSPAPHMPKTIKNTKIHENRLELAWFSDTNSFTDVLGIAEDEDGLYDLKI